MKSIILGYVFRTRRANLGNVVGSSAGKIDYCNGALQAEAMAAMYGLSFASDGISTLEIETDASMLKMAIHLHWIWPRMVFYFGTSSF